MARHRSIEISGLNIAMHSPHSPARYVDLFYDLLRSGRMLRTSNVHVLMLGSVFPENEGRPEDGLRGEVFRFVRIDPNEQWFNAETREAATRAELSEVNIPSHLLPHLQRISFVFRPHNHFLHYIKKDRKDSLGPWALKNLLDHMIKPLVDAGDYPPVEITVIPDEQSLDRIFNMPSIQHLIMEITRPNPGDDGQSEHDRWNEKLTRINARKVTIKTDADRGDRIVPDAEMRAQAEVAAMNGKVLAVGRDINGNRLEESTAQKSFVKSLPVNPNIQTAFDVLSQAASDFAAN